MLMGRFEDAVAGYQELIALDPMFHKGYSSMGRAYMQMGRYAEAIAMLERGCSLAGDMPNLMGALGQAYALAGDQPRARAILAALHERAQTEYVPNTSIAIVHLGLGEK